MARVSGTQLNRAAAFQAGLRRFLPGTRYFRIIDKIYPLDRHIPSRKGRRFRRARSALDRRSAPQRGHAPLLHEALVRGEIDRGEAPRITGLPERTARRVLNDVVNDGLLASATPKGPVSLRFPAHALEVLFPRLYPRT